MQPKHFHQLLLHSLLQCLQCFPLEPQLCPLRTGTHAAPSYHPDLSHLPASGATLSLHALPRIQARPASLHCSSWSSTDLQTSNLCRGLVFISASISINDNAELKVLDSNGHLCFLIVTAATKSWVRWKPFCLPGAMGAKEKTVFKAALQEGCVPSAQHQGRANGNGTQHKMQKCPNCSSTSFHVATQELIGKRYVPSRWQCPSETSRCRAGQLSRESCCMTHLTLPAQSGCPHPSHPQLQNSAFLLLSPCLHYPSSERGTAPADSCLPATRRLCPQAEEMDGLGSNRPVAQEMEGPGYPQSSAHLRAQPDDSVPRSLTLAAPPKSKRR